MNETPIFNQNKTKETWVKETIKNVIKLKLVDMLDGIYDYDKVKAVSIWNEYSKLVNSFIIYKNTPSNLDLLKNDSNNVFLTVDKSDFKSSWIVKCPEDNGKNLIYFEDHLIKYSTSPIDLESLSEYLVTSKNLNDIDLQSLS